MEPLSPEPPPVTRAPPPPTDISTPLSSIPSPANLVPPSSSSTQNLSELKSFKDTLIDGNATISQPLVTYEELVAANQTLEPPAPMLEDGDAPTQVKVPKVRIPKEIWQRLCTPWKNAVIIKLLGKSINFHVLHARLLKEWRTNHEFEIIDVGLGYYIVKFSSSQDCSMVLTGGPYKMFDHYLAVQPWEPGFHPARAKAPKTAVWVKLFGVPILCFYEAICMYLGSKIGKPIKVDPTTLLATRGQYARVCVEVDLSQPLPSSVDLDLEDLPQSLILVEYEGLHKICFHCGEFGHKMEFCRFKNPGKPSPVSNPNAKTMVELTQSLKPDPVDNNMVFGPWMVQQKKQRRRSQPHRSAEQLTGGDGSSQPLNTGNSNSVPSTSAKVVGLDRRAKSSAPTKSRTNRFEVIAEIMEEDSNLHISNKGKDTGMEGSAPQDMTQPLTTSPMDITLLPDHTAPQDVDAKAPVGQPAPTTINSPELALVVAKPLPAPSTSFIKPKLKNNKKKNKPLGPVSKVAKPLHPKPYITSSLPKKPSDANALELPSNQIAQQSLTGSTLTQRMLPSLVGDPPTTQLCNPSPTSSDTGQSTTTTSSKESQPSMAETSHTLAVFSTATKSDISS
ncbi:hypothetical protein SLE2022_167060 [Rubroshorea leprosula]